MEISKLNPMDIFISLYFPSKSKIKMFASLLHWQPKEQVTLLHHVQTIYNLAKYVKTYFCRQKSLIWVLMDEHGKDSNMVK